MVRKLEIAKPGLLDTLNWTSEARLAALGSHEVEIQAKAIGLNFKLIAHRCFAPYLLTRSLGPYSRYGCHLCWARERNSPWP
jgi:hypothetical protein